MAGSLPASIRNGSPSRFSEKPWDFWVSEIGRTSPLRDEDNTGIKGNCRRNVRRNGVTKLKNSNMSLYGEFPNGDSMSAAVCHMCDTTVKLTAVQRHLLENHSMDPIKPPPPPAVKIKSSSKSKHKHKETPLPVIDMDTAPSSTTVTHSTTTDSVTLPSDLPTAVVTVPHIVLTSQDVTYYPEIDTGGSKCSTQSEVKVSVEENDLPVVSIQDNTDLPLADDIIEIMNSEGIQSIDIPEADTAAWKNLMQDFGSIQDITLQNLSDGTIATHEIYGTNNSTPVRVSGAYTLTGDNTTLQYTQPVTLQTNIAVENRVFPAKPIQLAPVKPPSTKSKSKSSKTSKFQAREYDPNKHCGVICVDSQKPCTRSLTCKAHTLSLRRLVDGRVKSFDSLLAEHRASKQASIAAQSNAVNPPTILSNRSTVRTNQPNSIVNPNSIGKQLNLASQVNVMNQNTQSNDNNVSSQPIIGLISQPTIVNQSELMNLTNQVLNQQSIPNQTTVVGLSSPIVSTPIDINTFSELDPDRQVTEYYNSVMSSVSEVIGDSAELLVESGAPTVTVPPPRLPEPRPGDIYWYPSAPRPLAACTFSTCHMGNALMIGKRLATVRSNFKSTLMRPHTKNLCNNYYNFNQSTLSSRVNKNIHINNSNKPATPEIRKLIMSCTELFNTTAATVKTENSYYGKRPNGHMYSSKRQLMDEYDEMDNKCLKQSEPNNSHRNKVSNKHINPNDLMEFMNVFDPLIADEKC